jgi:ubiquinone/menaquinone biosynthesis C-methylase UbiE
LQGRQVDPALYTRAYYLESVQGHEEWGRHRGRRLPLRLAEPLRRANVKAGHRVLDVGTGRGEIALNCASMGAEAVGIDYADPALSVAREALEAYPEAVRRRCRFTAMDAKRLDFPDGSFDRIFMLDVVEHLYPEELQLALREARRVLKPGGLLVIHTEPNINYVKFALPLYQSRLLHWIAEPVVFRLTGSRVPFSAFRDAMHINEQSPGSLRAALNEAGFQSRVWASGLYGWAEFRQPRSVIKRILLTGWPVTRIWPLNETFGLNVWALARR